MSSGLVAIGGPTTPREKEQSMSRISRARTMSFAAAATVAAAALTGCAQEDSSSKVADDCKETYTVGFSHPVGEAQFVKALKGVVEDFGPSQCAEILLDNTTGNNLETQRETIENWVTQDVDAIVFWPVDPKAYANIVPQGQEKGIKWLTYVAPIDGQDGSVGFDPVQEGDGISEDVTAWLEENHPDGGVEAAVTKMTTQPTIAGRWEQPMATLKKLDVPVASFQDCSNQACGLEIAGQVLRENPDVKVFISYNDDVALGTQKAIENAGLDPQDYYVNGYDGSPEGLENVKAGKGAFDVTMAIPVKNLGQDIVKNALAAVTGDGDSASLTPSVKVTPKDGAKIDEFLEIFETK
jgi:ABC-type sugar transport system substrate-binding protein